MPSTDFSIVYVNVKGSQGRVYEIKIVGGHPTDCNCPHFVHRMTDCKHMKARMGSTAVGKTRCTQCHGWLSIEDIDAQPDPGEGDPAGGDHLSRLCDQCRS